MRAVNVSFTKGAKGYWYLVGAEHKEHELSSGSRVVVKSPYTDMTLAMVNTVNEDALDTCASEYIVDVVDDRAYHERKNKEVRLRAVKKALEKKANELLELKKYEILAEDEEGKKLLEELKKLS